MTHSTRRPEALITNVLPFMERPGRHVVLGGVLVLGLAACPAAPAQPESAPVASGDATQNVEAASAGAAGTGGPSAGTTGAPTDGAAAANGTGGTTGATTGETAIGASGAPGETGGAEEGAGDTGGTAGETGGVVDETTPLLDEAKKKKTSDEKATALLDDAKAKGATPNDVAKAANARGVALMGEPERAKPFFEYAMAADEKYPDAPFNLAKIAANEGDIDRVKELLAEVKARGGKKLLKTVGFDPTFALVAGEADVEKLLK